MMSRMLWCRRPLRLIGLLVACAAGSWSAPCLAEPKQIEIPKYQSDLPGAQGREAFATSCLACHSTAYITLQPPMTQQQWTDSVRKMQKTFGAPISEEEIEPIVQYILATTKSAGPRLRELPVPAAARNSVVLPATDPDRRKEEAARGAEVFATYCASCHGVEGTGDGPAGLDLLPRPQDLTASRFSDKHLAEVICNGVPGTGMLAFGASLSKDDLRAVIAFTATLCADSEPVATQPTSESKALYLQHCASCHGAEGAGNGPAAAALPRPATNFQTKRPSVEYAESVIENGIPGTAMPTWRARLNAQQRLSLAEYVRTFYQPHASR